MLILTRLRSESVMIGDDIQVTLVEIRGDRVRIGFDAPQNVPVHRREVWEAIQREQQRDVRDYADRPRTNIDREND